MNRAAGSARLRGDRRPCWGDRLGPQIYRCRHGRGDGAESRHPPRSDRRSGRRSAERPGKPWL